tara:strand:+ start:255 stop:1499 length:1245 start_codon:yes stop_codon:yes gene_type:complete
MFGSFIYSFKEKIAYGTPSGGSGGGSGTEDDPIVLDTIILSSGDGRPDDDDDDGSSSGGGGNSTPSDPEPTVEIVDVQHIETAIISGSGASAISGPVTLVIAEEYIIEHGAELEAAYAVQESFLASYGMENMSNTEIAFWMDFMVHEMHDGAAADFLAGNHLAARDLVAQGHSIAEAQMIVNGTTMDEAVFTDGAGNYAEADAINNGDVLFSSGIDVTDGVMIIEPNTDRLPSFAIPVQPGMEEYSTNSWFYHDYDSSVFVPLNGYDALRFSDDGLAALEAALIDNPTPGDDSAASINGTVNDVGNLTPLDGDDNFVFSFVVDNPDPNQSDIVVNYTIDDQHVLADGYVGRMIQRYDLTPDDLTDENYSYSLVTFGEGDAFIQGVVEGPAELVADYEWYQNSYEIFDTANDSLL